MQMARPQRGFTLLEMLVVMVLLGLVTSLALPAMQRWHDAVQLRAQAGLVVDVLRAAAFQAAATRSDRVVDATSFTQAAAPSAAVPAGSASAAPTDSAAAATLGTPTAPDTPASGAGTRAMPNHVAVTLASGWTVADVQPATFRANGLCDAGSFTLKPPAGNPVSIKVEGPVCRVALLPTNADAQ